MSNKFRTGTYYINVYDKYGTKQHNEPSLGSLEEARTIAAYLVDGTTDNYVISRVITNSIDDEEKW